MAEGGIAHAEIAAETETTSRWRAIRHIRFIVVSFLRVDATSR